MVLNNAFYNSTVIERNNTPNVIREGRRLQQCNRRAERRRNIVDCHRNQNRVKSNAPNGPIIVDRSYVIENPDQHFIGNMDVTCIHRHALHFAAESVSIKGQNLNSFNDCCNHGKVVLNENYVFPFKLKSLLLNTHEKSNSFFNNIRRYNNMMSFVSFNANMYQFPPSRNAPHCFEL